MKKENRNKFTKFLFYFSCFLVIFEGFFPNPKVIFQYSTLKHPERRVFDCFLYNGESTMLYIRLWRLYEYVDHFIIFMSNTSFSGEQRNLSFSPFEKEIMQFRSKIYILQRDVTYDPNICIHEQQWCREEAQRNDLIEGIKHYHAKDGDLIFLSDVDEILTKSGMEKILQNPPKDFYHITAVYLTPNFMYGNKLWDFAVVINYTTSNLKQFQWYREYRSIQSYPDYPIMTHCSYCFKTIEEYKFKLKSFSHQEYNKYPYTNDSFIFRMHYCRQQIVSQKIQKRNHWFDNEKLIPDDPRLNYLIDQDFKMNINQTIYNESILTQLCTKRYSFFKTKDHSFTPKENYQI